MPRWLFNVICTVAFAVPIGSGLLLIWPIVMDRPHPIGISADAAMLAVFALLFGAALAMLMAVPDRSKRRRR